MFRHSTASTASAFTQFCDIFILFIVNSTICIFCCILYSQSIVKWAFSHCWKKNEENEVCGSGKTPLGNYYFISKQFFFMYCHLFEITMRRWWMCDARERVCGKWLPSHWFTCVFECRASTVHTFINAHMMDICRLLKHCSGFVSTLSDDSLLSTPLAFHMFFYLHICSYLFCRFVCTLFVTNGIVSNASIPGSDGSTGR